MLLGFMCLLPFLIGGVLAVILGSSAKRQIRASRGAQGGDGLATAAVVIGWIDIAFGVLILLIVALLITLAVVAGGSSTHVYQRTICFGC
jgi:hypothetical protein